MPILVPEPAPAATTLPGSELVDAVWDYLPEYVKAADDGTLYAYLDAACGPVDSVMDVLNSGADMVDPYKAPTSRLDWVAAMAGVDLTSVPDAEARQFIADPTTRYRGNRQAIINRVALTLTGARRVFVDCPYDGDPLAIRVRTYAAETPDAAATLAAIRAEVPAWLVLTVDVAGGMTWTERKAAYDDWDDEKATGGTYDDLATETP